MGEGRPRDMGYLTCGASLRKASLSEMEYCNSSAAPIILWHGSMEQKDGLDGPEPVLAVKTLFRTLPLIHYFGVRARGSRISYAYRTHT